VRTQTPTPPVEASRVARAAARERRRRLIAVTALIALAGAAAAWLLLPGGAPNPPVAPVDAGADGPGPALVVPPTTFAISVRDAAVPLIAVVHVGDEGDVPVLTVPADLQLEVPGLGESSTAGIADQDPQAMRASLSNTVGTWIEHYLVLDIHDVAVLADATGGLTMTLPGEVTLSGRAVGPGDVTMDGTQIGEYLGIGGSNAFTRWEILLPALLSARTGRSLTGESDDLRAVAQLLPVGGEVRIDTFPTRISAGSTRVPDFDALDAMMASDFGVNAPPVPVLVQNGVGDPGIAAGVPALLVPKGFRVVLSTNADSFHHRTTLVIAGGADHVAEARRVVRALGVGELGVTEVPSGLADITIVIGKDFTA
jgi:LytR cell envelope-related transcriptional attenuator/LytR_cpsA_psr family